MKTFRLFLIAVLNISSASLHCRAQASTQSEIVKLAPVEVADNSLLIGLHTQIKSSKKTGVISAVTLKQVEPRSLVERAGLKAGDHIVAIDGMAISGLKIPEYLQLLGRQIKKGETATILITVERGFLRKRHDLKLSITW